MRPNSIKSFTLVELLIVIAILAVLAAAVVIILNPSELLAQARDAQRTSDLESLKKSADLFIVDNSTISLGTAQRVYISLPDTASNCPNLTATLPALPSGWQYVCATAANLRNTNGTGWVPINFNNIYGGSPIPYLPIDPSNDLASGRYYTYVMGGSYEFTALMEANKENVSVNDGGSLPGVFQVGTHIDLTPSTRDRGLVGHWAFEGSGSISNGQSLPDSSGRANSCVASNPNGTGMSFTAGQFGNDVQLDGVDDSFSCSNGSSLNITRAITISAWVNPSGTQGSYSRILAKNWFYYLYITATNYVTLGFQDGSPSVGMLTSASSLTNGSWQHIVGTYDRDVSSNNQKIYINGVLSSQRTGTGVIPNNLSTTLTVGAHSPVSYGFMNGSLDDVRLYNRALSAEEIKAIYEATR